MILNCFVNWSIAANDHVLARMTSLSLIQIPSWFSYFQDYKCTKIPFYKKDTENRHTYFYRQLEFFQVPMYLASGKTKHLLLFSLLFELC